MRANIRGESVIVKLTKDERKWLEERSTALGVTMSDIIRENVFKDIMFYETAGLDDKALAFVGRLARMRGKDLNSTINFLIHSCERGYEKKFAAAQVNFQPNA